MTAVAALQEISKAFTGARRAARALPGYPGAIPADLATSYAIQDLSLRAWPDQAVGWKVGMVPPAFRDALGAERLAGPIFSRRLWQAIPGTPTTVPVFVGGFAAVEAEFVVRLSHDLPLTGGRVSAEEATYLAAALHVGVEMAGSPLATINQLGPTVVASDFGNNAGLVLGPEIPGWREADPASLTCRTLVDGTVVGEGSAASVPGGPLAAFRFLLDHARSRGLALKAGTLVSTGATTGIHDIGAGQSARVEFDGIAAIELVTVAAMGEGDGA